MSATLLDLILISFVVLAIVRGYQRGLVVSLLGFIGFLAGGVMALAYGPQFVAGLSAAPRLISLVAIVLFSASIAQSITLSIANVVRDRLMWRPIRMIDSTLGAAFTVIGTVLLLWGLAAVLRVSPFPSVSNAVAHSRVVSVLDARVPDVARSAVAPARRVVEGTNFPQVFAALGPEPYLDASPPDPAIVTTEAVKTAFTSVAKINGSAASCRRLVEGSGFVVGPKYVMTNAHVVAGVSSPSVSISDRRFSGKVVYFDPKIDVAVIFVPSLTATSLKFSDDGKAGVDAVVAGFPENGPFSAIAARIRGQITAIGNDIYGDSRVRREVYAITATVRPGNSGGPLLASDGRVLGMVFARSTTDTQTGYALVPTELRAALTTLGSKTDPVSTGACD